MDIENWVNTVVRCNSDNCQSQYESKVADPPQLSRPKRKKHSSGNQNHHKRTVLSPDRAFTSGVCKSHTGDCVNDRKLVKGLKIGQSKEKATYSKGLNDASSNKYRRKPRRKTRPERYELKNKKHSFSNIVFKPDYDNQKPGKSNNCSERAGSDWPIPLGSKYLRITGLCPSRPRLSLPTKEKFGSQSKAQSAQMRPGLQDLVFANTSFLENAARQTCFCGQERQKSKINVKDRKQAMQEKVTNFSRDTKIPLAERDVNVVQNQSVLKTEARDLRDMKKLADLDKQYLDLKRREHKPRSSTCLTWSLSHSRSSIPASDLRSKTNRSKKCPGFSVQSNPEKQAIRSLPTQTANGELDEYYSQKRILKTNGTEKCPQEESSPFLILRSAEDLEWQHRRLVDGTKAERITRRTNGKALVANDELSLQDIVRQDATTRISDNFNRRGVSDLDLQEDDKICRSSSPVGRLLKECNNALAHGPCKEATLLPNVFTKDHIWLPERTKKSSFHDAYYVKPQLKSKFRPPNKLYNQLCTLEPNEKDEESLKNSQPYAPFFQYYSSESLPIYGMEIKHDDGVLNLPNSRCASYRNNPSIKNLSNNAFTSPIKSNLIHGFWKPQKLY